MAHILSTNGTDTLHFVCSPKELHYRVCTHVQYTLLGLSRLLLYSNSQTRFQNHYKHCAFFGMAKHVMSA